MDFCSYWKDFFEHKIFRLGDISKTNNIQIFETIEKRGYTIGCISPMNVRNSLNSPCYFLPDPWTIILQITHGGARKFQMQFLSLLMIILKISLK